MHQHDCKIKSPRPTDTWTNQNYIFDKNLMFPVDYEENVSDDFRTIFNSNDNVLRPVQYLWKWLFDRQSLGKTPAPQQLPPIIVYVTTEAPKILEDPKTTEIPPVLTTTTLRDEFIPVARTRRPLKYKVEGKCSKNSLNWKIFEFFWNIPINSWKTSNTNKI